MKELLKHGLNIDSENRQGLTAVQVSLAENNEEMVALLVMNGASVEKENSNDGETRKIKKRALEELNQQKDAIEQRRLPFKQEPNGYPPRISVYKGHPLLRNQSSESGKLIFLPNSIEELNSIIGAYD